MASSTAKRWVAVFAGIVLIGGVVAIAGIAVAANGPTPPDPPTDVKVTPTDNGATEQVEFTSPANDGGDPVENEAASCTSDDGGAKRTATAAASPIDVSGFTYGHTYTCDVAATNEDGTGVPSFDSEPFVPITVPTAPRSVTAVPYNPTTAKVIWNAPTSDGGSHITGSLIKPFQGSTAQPVRTFSTAATNQLVTGLIAGRSYSFQIAAVNAAGTGPYSGKTHPMIVGSPGQPQNVKAVKASSGAIRVTYLAPANNGATIKSFTAGCTSSNGGTNNTRTQAAAVPPASITVTGLTAGKTYTCVVKATNSRGTGPKSSSTAPVTA